MKNKKIGTRKSGNALGERAQNNAGREQQNTLNSNSSRPLKTARDFARARRKQRDSKRDGKQVATDIYEASESDDERRINNKRGAKFDRELEEMTNEMDPTAKGFGDDDEDEEISEDNAFDSEDEKKYGQFFEEKRGRSGGRAGKSKESDEEEQDEADEGEEDEDDDDDMMDLSELLGPSKSSSSKSSGSNSQKRGPSAVKPKLDVSALLPTADDDDDDGDHGFAEDDDEDDDDSDEGESEDGSDDGNDEEMTKLSSFVDSLIANHRRRGAKPTSSSIPERTEGADLSEFNVSAHRSASTGKKLDLSSLVAAVGDADDFSDLRKQLAKLDDLDDNKGAQKVSAPLPTMLQRKMDRKAAFEIAKKEVTKWQPIVKKNREADVLEFQEMAQHQPVTMPSNLVQSFKPETDFELEIQQALESSGLNEKDQRKEESLKLNKISKEEVLGRQRELAKMRSLLFYEEQKLKQMAKIKSKTYRKIRRRDKERQLKGEELTLEELNELDPEEAKAKLLKMERSRAEERMSLRHKNRGKWARQLLAHKGQDPETQRAIAEQLQLHDKLKRKIQGLSDSDDSSDAASSDGEDDPRDAAMRELEALEVSMREDEGELDGKKKGVMAMKFMQRNVEKERQSAIEAVGKARKGLEEGDWRDEMAEDDEVVAEKGETKAVNGSLRMRFGPDGQPARPVKVESKAHIAASERAEAKLSESMSMMDTAHGLRVSAPISIDMGLHVGKKAATMVPVIEQKPFFEIPELPVADVKLTAPVTLRSGPSKPSEKGTSVKKGAAAAVRIAGEPTTTHMEEAKPLLAQSSAAPEVQREPEELGKRKKQKTQSEPKKVAEKPVSKVDDEISDDEEEENPWLVATSSKSARSTNAGGSDSQKKNASKEAKSVARLSKATAAAQQEDDDVHEDTGARDPLVVVKGVFALNKAARSTDQAQMKNQTAVVPSPSEASKVSRDGIDSDSDDEIEDDGWMMHVDDVGKRLSRREVMQLAFANDEVAKDFQEEKQRVIEEDAPREVDMTLPGWGSWAGAGLKAKANKVVVTQPGLAGVSATERKDSHLQHVIINEKRIRKVAKYLLPDVPPTFETRQQYEAVLKRPMGKEWTTLRTHESAIKPRVATRMGVVIHPLKYDPSLAASGERRKGMSGVGGGKRKAGGTGGSSSCWKVFRVDFH
ncbi:Utp14 protein-domain-containing protein [Cladochytrium replicatum]|nr:Utp14 protein-domain-containing protein [Cladochytrium replicatum]